MPETYMDSLRSEMRSGFEAVGTRITAVENELHRHQDEDRTDLAVIRGDVRTLSSTNDRLAGRIEGALGTMKWFIGIPAFIAALGTMISLIRHW
jgi:hypothetical protein